MLKTMTIIMLGLSLIFSSCSPQWYLKKAEQKGAERITNTVVVPDIKIDTFYKIERDTLIIRNELDSIINSNPNVPDTCVEIFQDYVVPSIVEYIKTEKVIEGKKYYDVSISNDSVDLKLNLELWQDGDSIKVKTYLKDSKIKTEALHVEIDDSFLSKREEIVLALLSLMAVLVAIKRK